MQQTQTNRTRTQYCELCHTCHLQLEPCLIICHGTCNQKIKRGADYFVASDSSRVFCKKCYSNLNSLLPDQFHVDKENTNYTNNQKNQKKKRKIYYKRDLLKRKYEEEIPENWVSCTKCHKRMHHICALHNRFLMKDEDYVCPMCHCEAHVQVPNIFQKNHPNPFRTPTTQTPPHPHHPHHPHTHSRYTYKSGQAAPDPITTSVPFHTSNDLPTCALSRFIEGKIRLRMRELGFGGGPEKSISIRVVSETTCSYQVPEVIRRHYELYQNDTISGRTYAVPEKIRYTSKAILMFQTIDYVDVCLFCMYVHEYDTPHVPGDKRIYIAYLDSVDHFRPKPCRTPVYQEILVAYLAYARADGFVQAHIWSCPPLKGNNFIFWTHPNYQKTPNQERLTHWYEQVLARAIETGTVTAVKSLYDAIFKQNPQLDPSRPSVCPPIMEGDFWIDETQRVHHASLKRHLKNGSKKKSAAAEVDDRSTAVQIGNFLKNKVMEHPSAIPFNRPVNTVALKLFDYFDVIKRPMDLGTVQVRCLLGEFDTLLDVICDVKLVFDNARRYNPPGHIVHTMAVELEAFFIAGLQELLQEWKAKCGLTHTTLHTVQDFHSINLRLGQSIADQLQILVSPFTDHSPPSPTVAKIPLSPPPVTKRPAETLPLIRTNVVPSVRTATPSPTAAAPLRPPSALSRTPRPPLTTKPSRKVTGKRKVPRKTVTKLNLMHDGAAAVAQHMLGEEIFITSHKKKAKLDLPVAKLYSSLKRGSWLGEEVGAAVRKMRSNFFLCDLRPKGEPRMEEEEAKLGSFQEYVGDLERERRYYKPRCGVMDMRQNFVSGCSRVNLFLMDLCSFWIFY
uniref:histone acetyltransferase n=1 Tax=Corethron hystrix TaxID=216773 RepID=A0A7S1FM08_9STRA|mmetsp:Transcript_11936/g.26162  ORF Transcript_11936/g.26162 Transcript_11936/m.26162 type:complete len:843 (+) Transcript_11936:2-2530(+)